MLAHQQAVRTAILDDTNVVFETLDWANPGAETWLPPLFPSDAALRPPRSPAASASPRSRVTAQDFLPSNSRLLDRSAMCNDVRWIHTMIRVQILLAEEEDRELERLARRRRESKSSVVRTALAHLLRQEAAQADPLLGLIGQAGRVGSARAARDHDRILARAARRSS
jgi:predicted transcriptional regulator